MFGVGGINMREEQIYIKTQFKKYTETGGGGSSLNWGYLTPGGGNRGCV